jgi:hypothetical protein
MTGWNVHGVPRQHSGVWLWLFPNRLIILVYVSFDYLLVVSSLFFCFYQGKTEIGPLRYDLHDSKKGSTGSDVGIGECWKTSRYYDTISPILSSHNGPPIPVLCIQINK